MPKKRSESGLVKAGQVELWMPDALQGKKKTTLAKAAQPITPAQEKFVEAVVAIRQNPDGYDTAYMARELVQCTLPHSDPGAVPIWTRKNGFLTLAIMPGWDFRANQSAGFPYASHPRLFLFWLTTEAIRTGSRRLSMGRSYAGFLRQLGLDPNGGGKRSDFKRFRDQALRLLSARISFYYAQELADGQRERTVDMLVAEDKDLWWFPKDPNHDTLFESTIELGEKFHYALTAAPVPHDLRHVNALKKSPLALDLYVWGVHKVDYVLRKHKPVFVPWFGPNGLTSQFGADYKEPRNFRTKAIAAFRKIRQAYDGLQLEVTTGGVTVLTNSRLAVPRRLFPTS